jgi:hypothetical protein
VIARLCCGDGLFEAGLKPEYLGRPESGLDLS